MSAERLHDSVLRLLATAAVLETGTTVGEPVIAPDVPEPAVRQLSSPRRPSTSRVVVFALAYPAACIALLSASLAVGDVVLPRPNAPHLAAPLAETAGSEAAGAHGP